MSKVSPSQDEVDHTARAFRPKPAAPEKAAPAAPKSPKPKSEPEPEPVPALVEQEPKKEDEEQSLTTRDMTAARPAASYTTRTK